MDDWEWDDLEHGTHNVATNLTVRTRQTSETPRSNKDLPLTSQLHHIHEGEERKIEDDYLDREMDNLDWDVLEHPPNRDTITECESTAPLPTSLTCEQRQAYLLLCPANCGCQKSMPRLAKKSRVVKDCRLRNGNAELISNTCIAEGEIVAVFGETSTIWSQDDVREFKRIAAKQNETERDVQKFQFYVSGSNPENQCHLHIVPCEDAELVLSMEITSSLRRSLQSRSEWKGVGQFANHACCK